MPRNVRNFWLSATIDGRHSPYASGPEARDGGLDATLKLRDQGEISPKEIDIVCRALPDGRLMTRVYVPAGSVLDASYSQDTLAHVIAEAIEANAPDGLAVSEDARAVIAAAIDTWLADGFTATLYTKR